MISDFNLIGLSKPKSVTCSVIGGSQEIFWPKVEINQDRFDALWSYKKNHWDDKMIAKIEHDGLNNDGSPINGVLIDIIEL